MDEDRDRALPTPMLLVLGNLDLQVKDDQRQLVGGDEGME
jgi:hypothetical protein